MRLLPDWVYLQMMYFYHFHQFIHFQKPETFNEKLQWLKLYDRRPEYTTMVDKYRVKKYVADKIGTEHVIPLLQVWDKPEDITLDDLPKAFVLKWNHDSRSIVFCENKNSFDLDAAREQLRKGSHRSGFWYGREWPYKDVEPKIIAEPYIKDASGNDLTDYKIWCFGGAPQFTLVCSGRFSESGLHEDFYDLDWCRLSLRRPNSPNTEQAIPRPVTYEQMLQFATQLSYGIPFVRVDFYESCGKLYFGELTFFPASGFEPFLPRKWDKILGSWIALPNHGSMTNI